MWEFLAALVSALVALIGLLIGWRRARESALRREEVLAWSNRVIENMQGLSLICQGHRGLLTPEAESAKLLEIYFATSVLAEQGRLFFKNVADAAYGATKEEAYRGRRPEVLDEVLVAHQIAGAYGTADHESRVRMRCVIEDAVRRFVTLAQKEVGRSRTASTATSKGGTGSSLAALMQAVPPERLVNPARS